MFNQGPSIVYQHLPGHTAEVAEGPLQAAQPGRLALVTEGLHVQTPGIAEGGHEQVDRDPFTTDPDPALTEVDLQQAARCRLEADRGTCLGPQLLAQRCHGTFYRA